MTDILNLMKDDVGAVGGTVLTRGAGGPWSTKIEDIYSKANVQWTPGDKVLEVDHLHSTFLYRSNIVDYNLELSPVAHREETMFTHELKEKGYKLIVDQSIMIHHLKQQNTGLEVIILNGSISMMKDYSQRNWKIGDIN